MVFPWGAVINALVILAGASVGVFIGGRLPQRLQVLIFQLFGLCLLAIGLKMALGAQNILLVILSLVLGAGAGEILKLSQRLDALAAHLKKMVNSSNPLFAEGLVNGSVMVCAGAMAIVGSFEEGLGLGRTTVYAKTLIDFFACLILAARTGAGVLFIPVTVLVYQGSLIVLAAFLAPFFSPAMENCLQSVGGLMVMGIGLNMLGLKPGVDISNSLPALLFAALLPAIWG
ncbi:MAG: DUF554 domain-containing protein [Deltaproteobacteria bacterium]|nr:DUF554 domain-containing protein [Deltaproteobacteria bacterium]